MRRIVMLVVVTLVVATVIAPGVMAAPENFGGSENSTEHRNNASGTGNFGQCHQMGMVRGQSSSELNPSSQNEGEVDCRQASDQGAAVTVWCEEWTGLEATAEAQLTFQPSKGASTSGSCT